VKTSAREKRVLYAGIAIAAAIFVYYAATALSPGDGESLADKVKTQENLLRRQKEFIGREDFYKKRIEDAESDIEKIRTRLLPENNAAAANAELQRLLRAFADEAGISIASSLNLAEIKVADSDSLVKISVRIGIGSDCREEGLVDFLLSIKNYDKFLKVEEITNLGSVMSASLKRLVLRAPNMVVAGYIDVPPQDPSAKTGEDVAQAAASSRGRR